jgi:hypothetical protein
VALFGSLPDTQYAYSYVECHANGSCYAPTRPDQIESDSGATQSARDQPWNDCFEDGARLLFRHFLFLRLMFGYFDPKRTSPKRRLHQSQLAYLIFASTPSTHGKICGACSFNPLRTATTLASGPTTSSSGYDFTFRLLM